MQGERASVFSAFFSEQPWFQMCNPEANGCGVWGLAYVPRHCVLPNVMLSFCTERVKAGAFSLKSLFLYGQP